MGRVFRARDERLSRDIAVKVLLQGKHDEEHVRRFEREALAAGSLNHPNIVVVHDAGDEQGEPFLVTELLDGETLRAALKRGPMDAARATDVAFQIARGLAAAHEQGIVHRDLKPENVFLTRDGVIKILDFGIAQLPRESDVSNRWRTATGSPAVGTVSYMSPEQVHGHEIDARSDLFALGAVLHEMLGGSPPFDRATVLETGHAIVADPPPPIPRQTPPALASVVLRCLEKSRDRRYASAGEVVEALRKAAQWKPTPLARRLAVVVSVMVFSTAGAAFVWRQYPGTLRKLLAPPPRDERPLVAVAL
jgi:serine/threonine protein kinase